MWPFTKAKPKSPPPLCINCKYCFQRYDDYPEQRACTRKYNYACRYPYNVPTSDDLVTGYIKMEEITGCDIARTDYYTIYPNNCGTKGKHFEPKEEQQ